MKYIALFDLDGVILDTESAYTVFYNHIGTRYGKGDDFGIVIKGQTLTDILDKYFPETAARRQIIAEVNEFERDMYYGYIPGVEEFISSLKREGVRCAVVTSSNQLKMENVYRKLPDFREKFNLILTSEDFKTSKPSPECYLAGMRKLDSDTGHTVIFEDSINGLKAARGSGARVVGLTTSNPTEVVREYADIVIPDFRGYSFSDFIHR